MAQTFESQLWLPRSRSEVFCFFSDAGNLQLITPGWLNFTVLNPIPIAMRSGLLIDYKLRLRGIPFSWQSEITLWDPPYRFVDEQRRGPYQSWVHNHIFEEKNGGTLIHDHVQYSVPGGRLIDRLFVRRDVERIFSFRKEKLMALFG